MNFAWLNKKNNKKLIVFFNGWGSIEPAKLNFDDFDVLMFQDYKQLDNIEFDFTVYEQKYMVAWSLGVYVCNFYYEKFKDFNGFTAINGTLKPVDDNFGIPNVAYNLTVENFNELTCKKFIKKIGSQTEISRTIEDLRKELICIRDLKINKFLNFNKVIISTKDRIFPYKNMLEYWKNRNVEIIETQTPHYVFDIYKNWSDLI